MKNLSQSKLLSIEVACPPLELQRGFSTRLQYVVEIIRAQRRQLVVLDALFASLQHHAFAGTFTPSHVEATLASV